MITPNFVLFVSFLVGLYFLVVSGDLEEWSGKFAQAGQTLSLR